MAPGCATQCLRGTASCGSTGDTISGPILRDFVHERVFGNVNHS
jgi:hypothetical protein